MRKLKGLLLSLAVAAAVLLQAAPAKASQIPLSLQVIGYTSGGQQLLLGRVDGVITYSPTTVSYSLTFCRQSSYQFPYMRINVNSQVVGGVKYFTPITNIYPPYGGYQQGNPCYANVGVVDGGFSYSPLSNVEYIIYGSTFSGRDHVISFQDRIHYGPFNN
jgi:hypothetical protein